MKYINFSGEWCIIDNHNEMWPYASGAVENSLGKMVLEKVFYKTLIYEKCNTLTKKKLQFKQKIRKQLHAKQI